MYFLADKLEEALTSNSPDTILFSLFKFLMQAVFAAMAEENENLVKLDQAERAVSMKPAEEEEDTKSNDGSVAGTASGNGRPAIVY